MQNKAGAFIINAIKDSLLQLFTTCAGPILKDADEGEKFN